MFGSQKRTSLVGKGGQDGWRAEKERQMSGEEKGARAQSIQGLKRIGRNLILSIYKCQDNPLMILNEVGIIFHIYSYIFIHMVKGNSGYWDLQWRVGYTEGKIP